MMNINTFTCVTKQARKLVLIQTFWRPAVVSVSDSRNFLLIKITWYHIWNDFTSSILNKKLQLHKNLCFEIVSFFLATQRLTICNWRQRRRWSEISKTKNLVPRARTRPSQPQSSRLFRHMLWNSNNCIVYSYSALRVLIIPCTNSTVTRSASFGTRHGLLQCNTAYFYAI